MKRIILDFLRRWWVVYLIVTLLLGAVGAEGGLDACVTSVGFLMLPIAFELGRGPVGVMAAMPVSRKTIAVTYWCIGVLLPVLLMAGAIGLVVLPFHAVAISSRSIVWNLFSSLALAGSSYWLFTFMLRGGKGGNSIELVANSLIAWFLSAIMFSSLYQRLVSFPKQDPAAYFVGALGLLLTVWGYSRSERFIAGSASNRSAGRQYSPQSSKRIPAFKPGMAGFGGVLFNTAWRGFLAGLLVSTTLLVFRTSINDDASIWPWVFTFGGLGSVGLMCGAMRFLRTLPLSARRLALTLLFMPIISIVPIIAGVTLIKRFNPGLFLIHDSASLMIPMVGAVCFASSFVVRFGRNGFLLAMLLGLLAEDVICKTVIDVKWPAAFWWLLGLCLLVAAFFLNRHWLRSSASYRPLSTLR